MAGIKGTGPHHVEFGKPDFSGGRTKNRLAAEGSAVSSVGAPPSTGHSIEIKYAFGAGYQEAFDRLKTTFAVKHYLGLLALPMEWDHLDDPGAYGYAIEYLVKNPDGSLHDRLRISYDITPGAGGARAATTPRRAVGFEARVIRKATDYDYYFVWRPIAADGFVKSKIADMATFNKIWNPTVPIDVIEDSIFDAIPNGPAPGIAAGSFLCKSGPTTVYLIVANAWSIAGMGSARKFQVQNTGCFDYCGFNYSTLVDSATLTWPPGTSLAGISAGDPIDYNEAVILSS